jgi:Icc-related predicted phosphoesterase
MSGKRVSRILCAADPAGSDAATKLLIEAAEENDVDAIALIGDLSDGGGGESYRRVLEPLGKEGRPTYWVPGAGDAPFDDYMREAYNMEVVFPGLRGVHGTAALAPDQHVVFAGFGGEVRDDPVGPRDETATLSYPHWQAEYRLKLLADVDEQLLVLLFCTPPAHKGRGTPGSEALAELAATHRARIVVCGGDAGTEMIGRTLVVAPGSLANGEYAVADLQSQQAELTTAAAAG